MLPETVFEQSLGAPAQRHAIRATAQALCWKGYQVSCNAAPSEAVLCAVSEQAFEPRLADAEPHSAGLSPRASRDQQIIWRATCHLLTIHKPAAPGLAADGEFPLTETGSLPRHQEQIQPAPGLCKSRLKQPPNRHLKD